MKTVPYLLLFALAVSTISVYGQSVDDRPDEARFVWVDHQEDEIFQVAYFRREIEVNGTVEDATLHLFADSRYVLMVNGEPLHFGPARFYPAHPTYDTYDLRPYLRPGRNVIGVKVLSNGAATFQLRRHRPGFWARGQVQCKDQGASDLRSNGNNWYAHRAEGYLSSVPKITFALGPMEVYDARCERDYLDWATRAETPDGWEHPVLIEDAEWGTLTPRSIPHLTQTEYLPWKTDGIFAFDTTDVIYSSQVIKTEQTWAEYRKAQAFKGYTYLYSPRAQRTTIGVGSGEYRLNDSPPLPLSPYMAASAERRSLALDLHQGWNRLDANFRTGFGARAILFSLAVEDSLQMSPFRKLDDSIFLATTTLLDQAQARPKPAEKGPESAIDAPRGETKITYHFRDNTLGNPALQMVWQPILKNQIRDNWPTKNLSIPAGQGTAFAFDFRHKRLGRIVVEYEAPAGTVFDISFAEDTLADGRAFLMKRDGLYMGARHVSAGGKGRFETIKPYGLRYLQVNVYGHSEAVTLKKVAVINQIYPFKELGSFRCSDPLLNDIWELGWRSLRVCAEDSYTDTPFRERGLYAGDMLPQVGVTLTRDSDLRLAKRSLELFQDMYIHLFEPGKQIHPDEITVLEDYPLLTLEALDWYFKRTQDSSFVRRLYPHYDYLLRNQLDKRNAEGLLKNENIFIEWTKIEKKEVVNTVYHCLLYRSSGILAEWAKWLDRPVDAAFYAARNAEIAATVTNMFWDEKQKLFRDGIKSDTLIDSAYPISSAWPYLAGLTPKGGEDAVLDYISSQLEDIGDRPRDKRATAYGSFYILSALLAGERTEVVELFIRKEWSPMIYKRNDTAWENFDDQASGTLSHAWSAGPTYLLSSYTLGVKLGWPESVPVDTILVAPQAATVDWAEGTVPHPAGLVHVRWELRGTNLLVDVKGPPGIPVVVRPRGRLAQARLVINGQVGNK